MDEGRSPERVRKLIWEAEKEMYGDNLYAKVGIRNLRKIGIIETERFWDINSFPDLKGNAFLGQ